MVEFKPLISVSYELVFQLINTFLVFWILKKLLFKPVMDIIEARENDIKSDLAEGERAKTEGLSLKKEYEERISTAKAEGQEIIKQATLRAEQKEAEIISTAKQEAQSLKEKASKGVQLERDKAVRFKPTAKLTRYNGRIAAVRTVCCRCVLIAHYLCRTGRAGVKSQFVLVLTPLVT